MVRTLLVCLLGGALAAACAPEVKPPVCGEKGCPAGGELTSEAEARSGVEASGGGSATTQSASASYRVFGEGSCKYACRFPKCPEGTTPDIALDHFRCAPSASGGPK